MAPPQQLRQQTSNCSLLLIYRPRKDERLSWPGWLTCSGWFTHLSGHPSTTGRAKARRLKTDVIPLDHAANSRPYLRTLYPTASERSKLAQLEYKKRHDEVAGIVHWSLCEKYMACRVRNNGTDRHNTVNTGGLWRVTLSYTTKRPRGRYRLAYTWAVPARPTSTSTM